MIAAKARQAFVQAARDRARNIATMLGAEPHLGPQDNVGPQRLENAAEVAFGLAVAVERRCIDIVDAGRDCARQRPLLIGCGALGEEAADGTGAVAQHRGFEAGPAKAPLLHQDSPSTRTLPASLSTTTWLS